MKITYRIEQYDVDDFKVIVTKPECFSEVYIRIHTPYFLLSELQRNIKKNLRQKIRTFCKKHTQYADIIYHKNLEIEPDEHDVKHKYECSCWFYTGKFIGHSDNTTKEVERAKKLENFNRYYTGNNTISKYLFKLESVFDPSDGLIVLKKSPETRIITASVLCNCLNLCESDIKYMARMQEFTKDGNKYRNLYFPRRQLIPGTKRYYEYPLSEVNLYLKCLYENDINKYREVVAPIRAKWYKMHKK